MALINAIVAGTVMNISKNHQLFPVCPATNIGQMQKRTSKAMNAVNTTPITKLKIKFSRKFFRKFFRNNFTLNHLSGI